MTHPRCICCMSGYNVQPVSGLPWCDECVELGYQDEYAARVGPFLCAALDAEVERRHIPPQVRLTKVR